MEAGRPVVKHFYRRFKAGELSSRDFIRIVGMARREDA